MALIEFQNFLLQMKAQFQIIFHYINCTGSLFLFVMLNDKFV